MCGYKIAETELFGVEELLRQSYDILFILVLEKKFTERCEGGDK